MARRFTGGQLVIASHNRGKVTEIAALLEPFGADVMSAGQLGLPEPVEDGDSFSANAAIKAQAAAAASGLPALADDSGLAVTALGGRPGIHSARWAGDDKNFAAAMARIEESLGDNPDRSACFVCALALAWPDGDIALFDGRIDGFLVWPPRGANGFGYDPVFMPHGEKQTFGEMAPVRKHAMSHRATAFRQLVAACFDKQ